MKDFLIIKPSEDAFADKEKNSNGEYKFRS